MNCSREEKIDSYNLNPFLAAKIITAKIASNKVELNLCAKIPFKWDKMIVVSPYTTPEMIRKFELDNSSYVENNLLDVLYQESDCLLLFIEKNRIVRYSYVPRVLIDFSNMNETFWSKTIPKKVICEQLYIQYVQNNLKLYY